MYLFINEVSFVANPKGKTPRFKIFDFQREGRGVSKREADLGTGLKRFFTSLKNHFNKIIYVNILMVLGNFPVFFLVAALSGYTQLDTSVPMYDIFQSVSHMFSDGAVSAFDMAIYALTGIQNQTIIPSTLTYVFYGISALALLTFGCVNVGTAYILRNIAMGEPVFTWSDFWYAIKRNWKQALPFGIIDIAIHAILIFNVYNFLMSSQSWFESTMMWMNIVILILYFFMRYYIYVQMVTFKLSVFKILKNSLIFALLGVKRNLMALLGIIIALALEVLFVFSAGGILMPVGVAMPLILLFSLSAYMKVFAAYYKIKEVMIDPYKAEHPDADEDDADDADDEPIMQDDVTYNERLAEIKRRNGIVD